METTLPDDEEYAVAFRAASDQEIAEWSAKGEKLGAFYKRLMDAGMKPNLAGVLTINEQNHQHVIEDEDEDA